MGTCRRTLNVTDATRCAMDEDVVSSGMFMFMFMRSEATRRPASNKPRRLLAPFLGLHDASWRVVVLTVQAVRCLTVSLLRPPSVSPPLCSASVSRPSVSASSASVSPTLCACLGRSRAVPPSLAVPLDAAQRTGLASAMSLAVLPCDPPLHPSPRSPCWPHRAGRAVLSRTLCRASAVPLLYPSVPPPWLLAAPRTHARPYTAYYVHCIL